MKKEIIMEGQLTPNDPRVIEMAFNVFEKILTAIDYKSKEELVRLATLMLEKVQEKKYPEILRMAYSDAKRKIELLSLEQLDEIKQIIVAED